MTIFAARFPAVHQQLQRWLSAGDAQDRAQVDPLLEAGQAVTDHAVTAAFVNQGYTGADPAAAATAHGVQLLVVKHPEGTRGFVPLPRRWVVERAFAWMAACRRLTRGYERKSQMLRGFTVLSAVLTLLPRIAIAYAS